MAARVSFIKQWSDGKRTIIVIGESGKEFTHSGSPQYLNKLLRTQYMIRTSV